MTKGVQGIAYEKKKTHDFTKKYTNAFDENVN